MALYVYIKEEPRQKLSPLSKKRLSFVLAVFGLVLIGNAIIPIVNYQLRYSNRFGGNTLSPVIYRGQTLGQTVEAQETKDYTMISSWFNEEIPDQVDHSKTTHYSLSIPKLKIKNAVVEIGGEDLKKTLVQYPDTAFPGQMGNAVVFGHSVLPQFFNPNNYLTIFSTLHTLKEGDEILVDFDGVAYRYLVEDMFEVKSTDLSVLEQRYDQRALTLITCTPPGTFLRRLIVRARLLD